MDCQPLCLANDCTVDRCSVLAKDVLQEHKKGRMQRVEVHGPTKTGGCLPIQHHRWITAHKSGKSRHALHHACRWANAPSILSSGHLEPQTREIHIQYHRKSAPAHPSTTDFLGRNDGKTSCANYVWLIASSDPCPVFGKTHLASPNQTGRTVKFGETAGVPR